MRAPSPPVNAAAGNGIEDDDPATSWWRFYPDVLEAGPAPAARNNDRIGSDDDDDDGVGGQDPTAVAAANRDDDDLLAATVQAQAALRNRTYSMEETAELLKVRNAQSATAGAAPANPANAALEDFRMLFREPERDENLLYLGSVTILSHRRFPMPPGFVTQELGNYAAPRGLMVARVVPMVFKHLQVSRPLIERTRIKHRTAGPVLETVEYRLPVTDPRVKNGEWDKIGHE
ncbi:hypothetical protein GGF32_006345 [Allomyces javanicus]|nr:hypothetical protein GGF32_006345 [Allomyces javanicus]